MTDTTDTSVAETDNTDVMSSSAIVRLIGNTVRVKKHDTDSYLYINRLNVATFEFIPGVPGGYGHIVYVTPVAASEELSLSFDDIDDAYELIWLLSGIDTRNPHADKGI